MGTLFALVITITLILGGCDRGRAPQHSADDVPLAEAEAGALAGTFSGQVPRLRGAAPRDTLAMLRQFGDTVTLGLVTRVRPVGRFLVAADRFMSPHLVVFDRATGTLLTRFGRDGEGPGEFRDPADIFVEDREGQSAWIYDFHNRRATRVELDRAGRATVGDALTLNVGAPLESPVWIGGGIVSNGLFPDYTLLAMDAQGTPLRRISADVPFARQIQNTVGGRQANRSFAAANPSRDRLVLAYQWTSRLDFFTGDGARYGTVSGPRPVRTRYRVDGNRFEWEDDTEVAYWGADATDEHVLAMFCGCTAVTGDQLPDRVHVYRWNGDFVAELALDRPLVAMSVSPDGRRLYGAFVEPVPGIGEWALPEFD